MAWLVLALIVFHGLHSIRMVVPQWRQAQIVRLGEGKWKGLVSLALLLSLIFLIWAQITAPAGSNTVPQTGSPAILAAALISNL